MNSWLILILAGLCEIVWALGLKYSDGLKKPFEAFVTIIFMIVSLWLLAVATREIPIGIAYSIWVGIGAIGAFIGGIYLFSEEVSFLQIIFFCIVLVGMIGLKITSINA